MYDSPVSQDKARRSYGRLGAFGGETAASCEGSVYRRRSASHTFMFYYSLGLVYNDSVMKHSRIALQYPRARLNSLFEDRPNTPVQLLLLIVLLSALCLEKQIHFINPARWQNLQPDFKTFWRITEETKKKNKKKGAMATMEPRNRRYGDCITPT